jgi:hypothetical protein
MPIFTDWVEAMTIDTRLFQCFRSILFFGRERCQTTQFTCHGLSGKHQITCHGVRLTYQITSHGFGLQHQITSDRKIPIVLHNILSNETKTVSAISSA